MLPSLRSLSRIRFVRDIVTMQIGKFVPMVAGLLSSTLYARILGLGGYGDYAVVLAMTGVLGFVTNLGQHYATMTFLAEAYGRKDRRAQAEAGHYYAVMSLGTIVLLAVVLPFLPALA